jgi:hypothetical protein
MRDDCPERDLPEPQGTENFQGIFEMGSDSNHNDPGAIHPNSYPQPNFSFRQQEKDKIISSCTGHPFFCSKTVLDARKVTGERKLCDHRFSFLIGKRLSYLTFF